MNRVPGRDPSGDLQPSSPEQYSDITLSVFADIFGSSVKDIPEPCKKVLEKSNFKYRLLTGAERENVFLRIIKTLLSDTLKVTGPHRKQDWEKGWSENLEDYRSNKSDLSQLIPKFVKQKEIVRFRGNYILPIDPHFETNFVTCMRYFLFSKYFADVSSVYEFGCGTGLNLVAVAGLFPEKELCGLDWSQASCDIVDELAKTLKLKLKSKLFDMFSPDETIKLDNTCAVFTIGAMEQLGTNFKTFTDFLLEKRPAVCINIETNYELLDKNVLFDYLGALYLEKRNYLRGYLDYLKQLEKNGKIKILETRKTIGSLYHEGYAYTVWKPVP
jgi:SAM-dependent methyltransferase